MAGVGEASAIVGLIATAAHLSKAVIDIASKYQGAQKQIDSFGHEVAILGNILDQLYRLQSTENLKPDGGAYDVTLTVLDQCSDFFSELDTYKDTLYSRQGSIKSLTFRGRAKWVFEATELAYLRARLDSMKINMLLMMTMQCTHGSQRPSWPRTDPATQENVIEIRRLSLQSSACVRKLEDLEEAIAVDSQAEISLNRMSIRTVDTSSGARSIRESILSMYGHVSYYERIVDPRKGNLVEARDSFGDQIRISQIIEGSIENAHAEIQSASSIGALSDRGKKRNKTIRKIDKSQVALEVVNDENQSVSIDMAYRPGVSSRPAGPIPDPFPPVSPILAASTPDSAATTLQEIGPRQQQVDVSSSRSRAKSLGRSVRSSTSTLQALYARALYDYDAECAAGLNFREGDTIVIITQLASGWWDGIFDGVRGWFPGTYVETLPQDTFSTDVHIPPFNRTETSEESDTEEQSDEYSSKQYSTKSQRIEVGFWVPQLTNDGRPF